MFAEERADMADDTRTVFVFEEEENAFGLGLDVAAVDDDHARFLPEEGAGSRRAMVAILGGDLDQIAEFRAVADPRLHDLEAEVLC